MGAGQTGSAEGAHCSGVWESGGPDPMEPVVRPHPDDCGNPLGAVSRAARDRL